MELNPNRKRSRFTVHVLRFAHSKNTHLISDAHTMRSKYHCDSVCSHARSSPYRRNNHMAARRAVRHYSDTIFPRNTLSHCMRLSLFAGTCALCLAHLHRYSRNVEKFLQFRYRRLRKQNIAHKRDGTDTDAINFLSLSLAFTHSQFLNSHKFMFEHTDEGETVKQMNWFCCQIACVEIVSILFFHGLKV